MSKKRSIIENIKKTPQIFWVRLSLAFYFLIIMLIQLFSFDKFPDAIADTGVDQSLSTIAAIALALAGLLSLPHLIGMKISPKLLKLSSLLSPVFLAILTALEITAFCNEQTVLFGATFDLPGGSWSLLFIAALWLLWLWSVALVLSAGVKKKTGVVKKEKKARAKKPKKAKKAKKARKAKRAKQE